VFNEKFPDLKPLLKKSATNLSITFDLEMASNLGADEFLVVLVAAVDSQQSTAGRIPASNQQ
jgi:hypothetical protein